jgi:hypothetical protein
MFSAIGNLLGRKAPKPVATPSTHLPQQLRSSAPSRRREDPRDIYSRVFRFRPTAGAEMPDSVEIVGSFTGWRTVALTHNPVENTWSVTIEGIPGKKTHHYMLLVNGKPVHDPACDGLAEPVGFDEEQFALTTERGPRVLILFAQTK